MRPTPRPGPGERDRASPPAAGSSPPVSKSVFAVRSRVRRDWPPQSRTRADNADQPDHMPGGPDRVAERFRRCSPDGRWKRRTSRRCARDTRLPSLARFGVQRVRFRVKFSSQTQQLNPSPGTGALTAQLRRCFAKQRRSTDVAIERSRNQSGKGGLLLGEERRPPLLVRAARPRELSILSVTTPLEHSQVQIASIKTLEWSY